MKKIPDNATLVFKGVLHDVYHWDQEMFDGSITTFEALKRRDAVNTIAVTDNKIIIDEEEQPGIPPFLSFPGGNSETGVFMEDAKRELLEETGYESNEWSEFVVIDILNYHKLEWNNHLFIAKNAIKTKEQALDSGEKVKVGLYTFDEFLELRNNPKFRHKDFIPILEKAAHSSEEKQILKTLLGITT
jgi:8-oxo-dGTP pyrophosphatase MutT (NUDIX family)